MSSLKCASMSFLFFNCFLLRAMDWLTNEFWCPFDHVQAWNVRIHVISVLRLFFTLTPGREGQTDQCILMPVRFYLMLWWTDWPMYFNASSIQSSMNEMHPPLFCSILFLLGRPLGMTMVPTDADSNRWMSKPFHYPWPPVILGQKKVLSFCQLTDWCVFQLPKQSHTIDSPENRNLVVLSFCKPTDCVINFDVIFTFVFPGPNNLINWVPWQSQVGGRINCPNYRQASWIFTMFYWVCFQCKTIS